MGALEPRRVSLCGRAEEILPTLDAESFDLIHADPPYFRVLAEGWDRQWKARDAFLEWLGSILDQFRRLLKPNGSLYVWASSEMAAAVEELVVRPRFAALSSIAWKKSDSTNHRCSREELRAYQFLRRDYEELRRPFFVSGRVVHTDVWEYESAERGAGRHPAEKPLPMMRDIVRTSTREGAQVLDAFAGSGSMSAACVDLGRSVVAVEMDADLCRDIERRIDRHAAAKSGELHRVEMAPIHGPLFED